MEKHQITTDGDLNMAMSSVQSACQLLAVFDWQCLYEQLILFESVGPVTDPGTFLAMQGDPQWEQKKQLFSAAAKFVREIEDIRRQISHEK